MFIHCICCVRIGVEVSLNYKEWVNVFTRKLMNAQCPPRIAVVTGDDDGRGGGGGGSGGHCGVLVDICHLHQHFDEN